MNKRLQDAMVCSFEKYDSHKHKLKAIEQFSPTNFLLGLAVGGGCTKILVRSSHGRGECKLRVLGW